MTTTPPHTPPPTPSTPAPLMPPQPPAPGAHEANLHQHHPRNKIWMLLVAVFVLAAAGAFVVHKLLAPSPIAETDDARISVHYTVIAPRVSTQVIAVPVRDNQFVKRGDLLVQLDPKDFETAVANARAALQRDQARVVDSAAAINRQPSVIDQSQASVPAAQAKLMLAQQNELRYRNLATSGAGTLQSRQQAESLLKQAEAELAGAQAALVSSQQQTQILEADRKSAEAQVRADQASLDQALLNLQYARITAPIDGYVGQLAAEVGDYATVGGPLMSVVPLQDVYVEANYREVQLQHVQPGQPVAIHVDAYKLDLKGTVDSIAPASGATFSSIPPENATGNFTKIVQRLSVKILVNPNQPEARLLRVGMNVVTRIDTNLADVVGAERRTGTQHAMETSR